MLVAAEMRTNYNDPTAGRELMDGARPIAPRASWLRTTRRNPRYVRESPPRALADGVTQGIELS